MIADTSLISLLYPGTLYMYTGAEGVSNKEENVERPTCKSRDQNIIGKTKLCIYVSFLTGQMQLYGLDIYILRRQSICDMFKSRGCMKQIEFQNLSKETLRFPAAVTNVWMLEPPI